MGGKVQRIRGGGEAGELQGNHQKKNSPKLKGTEWGGTHSLKGLFKRGNGWGGINGPLEDCRTGVKMEGTGNESWTKSAREGTVQSGTSPPGKELGNMGVLGKRRNW